MTSYNRMFCRLCDSSHLATLFSLPKTPAANSLLDSPNEDKEYFPLDVNMCTVCGHVQLKTVVDADYLFSKYPYKSGVSPTFTQHLKKVATYLIDKCKLKEEDTIVEIGSNDGTLLKFFDDLNYKNVIGVEPSNLAKEAINFYTINDYFSYNLSLKILSKNEQAKLIVANNVFAHIDDLHDIVKGVKTLLSPNGYFVFEVNYLGDILNNMLFDTIYHEHMSYHSIRPLINFFDHHELKIVDIDRIDVQGGSIRVYVVHKNNPTNMGFKVFQQLKIEKEMHLHNPATWRNFHERILKAKKQFHVFLKDIKPEEICGFGAPAKAVTFAHMFGITKELIPYIVDENHLKVGKYLPGLKIPIISVEELEKRSPKYVVIFAWNFARNIIERYKKQDREFITLIPDMAHTKYNTPDEAA